MVDCDDAQGRAFWNFHWNCRWWEWAPGLIYRYWIMRRVWVTRHVADDAEVPIGACKAFLRDEGRDGRGEVDTVNKNVRFHNLLERAAFCGLCHVPFNYVRVGKPNVFANFYCALATSSKRADYENARRAFSLWAGSVNRRLDVYNQSVFIWVRRGRGERCSGVKELVGPV